MGTVTWRICTLAYEDGEGDLTLTVGRAPEGLVGAGAGAPAAGRPRPWPSEERAATFLAGYGQGLPANFCSRAGSGRRRAFDRRWLSFRAQSASSNYSADPAISQRQALVQERETAARPDAAPCRRIAP